MGLIETLSKECPVPYKRTRDMSESEYMKLVDRNTDLLDENKTLKEEIERLKELCNKYEEEHKTVFEEWKKTINIINELEKFLNELKIDTENDIKYARSKNDDEEIIRLNREFNMTDMIFVKLQELKGEQ